MQERIQHLRKLLNEIYDLEACQALLGWDQQTLMPSGAAQGRGYQLGTIAKVIHSRRTSPELGSLLDRLMVDVESLDPDSDEACLIKLAHREFDKNRKIDPQWVDEMQQVTAQADMAWRQARAESDFQKFQPWMVRIVDLARRYARFFEPYQHSYDPLLDVYEPGLKTREVQAIFDSIRPEQIGLLRSITGQPQIDDSFLHQHFPIEIQRQVNIEALTALGYDWAHGRLDVSAHPFTNGIGAEDVRMTTRFSQNGLDGSLLSSMHECGHALYELGQSANFSRTSMAQGASSAFHESQSRLYENLIGRSLPFWTFFYPCVQAHFPEQLGKVQLEDFYRGINRVKPSLIRVEADEVTYNLHIMLRLDLEIALVEGSVAVADLPEIWNDRMRSYVGIAPSNDADGVLQDIHWSMGLFGYFSTYALGNLISAQVWQRLRQDIPDLDEQMAQGDFLTLLEWLRKNIHRYGRKYEPQKLIERITGSRIDPAPYLRYLKTKYSEIYHL